MLQLKSIVKAYMVGGGQEAVLALRGVDIAFRDSEFVAVLGPSGCGKTTLLNILGGLDRYTSGDMIINGRSTKEYAESDWDTYRNHSIGFVFQSYNLIPHQSVLANVELALTLSGVSRAERRRRAIDALEKVGLGDQIHKKPNQMSGGQMQRVAIARALVNDPDILLADEPTGALDTATSVQIMDILREISKDKLILMVTHNPELAEAYANRIVRLVDGQVTGDTNPYTDEEAEADAAPRREAIEQARAAKKKKKRDDGTGKGRRSMSFFTALSLSFQNLMTKKGRTFLTSFAGSIGIIGIALILALSSGVNAYIAAVQEDTLSTYPLSIQEQTQDMSAMLGAMTAVGQVEDHRDSGKIYVDDSMGTMMSAMNTVQKNNLGKFKAYIDAHYDELEPHLSAIQYTYDFDLQVFTGDGKTQVNPTTIFDNMGEAFSGVSALMGASGMNFSVLSEMIDNEELLKQQYELVDGEWPDAADELVLVISSNNQISKMTLYMLGVLEQSEIKDIISDLMQDGSNYDKTPMGPIDFDYFIGRTFRLLNTSDFFDKTGREYTVDGKTYPIWNDIRKTSLTYDQESFVKNHGIELKITGIIRPQPGVAATSIATNLAYTKDLTNLILEMNKNSEVINQQKEQPEYNVLTGLKYERTYYTPATIGELIAKIDSTTMSQFYAVMRDKILSDPEYSGMLDIKDAESFLGFYMMMPAEKQIPIMQAVLSAALENSANTTMLFQILTAMTAPTLPGVPINEKTLIGLMLSLPVEVHMVALNGLTAEQAGAMGIPMAIPGLISMAGEKAMSAIYAETTEQVKTMEITEEVFLRILGTLDGESEAFRELENTLYNMAVDVDATLESTLKTLGDAEAAQPASINFYAIDFKSKDAVVDFIEAYNEIAKNENRESDVLKYSDLVGALMSSVTTIVDAISYVLIAFVSISLVVSSIMIGIITYISVLERTKEIGILRAIGASRRDVSLVFNAETLLVGFTAGVLGILISTLLCLPINAIVQSLSGIPNLRAFIPWQASIILVVISMVLTLIAGLFPAGMAARKDPVIALRTE